MPDNIAHDSGGNAMMAYQGEEPWHHLGTKLDIINNVDEALVAARLNWEVACHEMFVDRPVSPKDKEGLGLLCDHVKVPNRRAVVRLSDWKVLGTVGMSYQPLQNRDAFSVLDIVCAEHGVTIETAGALGNGEQVWMLARLPNTQEVVDGDVVKAYALILTGHDGATPNTGRLTAVRVVCANTLAIAVQGTQAMYRISHGRKDKDQRLAEARWLITNLVKQFNLSVEDMRRMARHRLNALELGAYIDAVLQIPNLELASKRLQQKRQLIVDLVYRGKGAELAPETVWTAYNAFTEFVDHVQPAQASPQKRRRANENALFGAGALLKARALQLALGLIQGTLGFMEKEK